MVTATDMDMAMVTEVMELTEPLEDIEAVEESQMNGKKIDPPIREVDTKAYMDVMKELVQEGKTVSILVSGSSMSPFLIHRRDRVFFEQPDSPLKRGDIVFYQRESGQYVMHRIWKIKEDGLYIVGDAQTQLEGPVSEQQVFARISKCERDGKCLTKGDFWWDFFEKVWIRMVPIRPWIWKCYEKIRRLRGR